MAYSSATVNGDAHPTGSNSVSIFTSLDGSKTTGITLYLDSLTPGIYSYNAGSGNALQYNNGSLTYGTVPGTPGAIIITSGGNGTNSITGSFSGVVVAIGDTNTVVISDGVFTGCAY